MKSHELKKIRMACLPKGYKFPSYEEGIEMADKARRLGWNYVYIHNRFNGTVSVSGTPPHRNFEKIITEYELAKEWT